MRGHSIIHGKEVYRVVKHRGSNTPYTPYTTYATYTTYTPYTPYTHFSSVVYTLSLIIMFHTFCILYTVYWSKQKSIIHVTFYSLLISTSTTTSTTTTSTTSSVGGGRKLYTCKATCKAHRST